MNEGKNGKSDSKEEQPKSERKFSKQQYDMLLRCSKKKDMTEWNKWRKEHHDEKILLQGVFLVRANLQGADLPGANLQRADLPETNLQEANLAGANLQGAYLPGANLQGANLWGAELQGAKLSGANLQGANLLGANLQEADLVGANLQKADLGGANLQGAFLRGANLQGANLRGANLQGANLRGANLQEANLHGTDLRGTDFVLAIVDGSTLIVPNKIDRFTNFSGVGLDAARIYPEIKQLLEYNIRRMNWEDWYKRNPKLKWLVKPFWLMSDYGMSTKLVILTFFGLALVFANIYYHCGRLAPPGIVANLFVDRNGVAVQWWLVPLRALYFSIVTMTTLGFGDMYAKAQSIFGHLLLILQVLLGYVLLGALITRFAVLFTTGGPAGTFSEGSKKKAKKKGKE